MRVADPAFAQVREVVETQHRSVWAAASSRVGSWFMAPDCTLGSMRIVLVLALLVSAVAADDDPVAAERAANRALLEKEPARLANVPRGHFVVVVGGESFTHGPELEPLLKAADEKFPNALHRFVFRKGDEGPRKLAARPKLRSGQAQAGERFFAATRIGLVHTGRNWRVVGPDPDTVAPCRTGLPPSVRANVAGDRWSVELFPTLPMPLLLNRRRVELARFEIPGYAYVMGSSGLDWGYRRYFAAVELPDLGVTAFAEVWSNPDRWRNMERELFPEGAPAHNSWEFAQRWTTAALQTEDGALRERTLAEMREALRGNDPARTEGALQALSRIRDLKYDKASFRPLVLPYLEAKSGSVCIAACWALYNTEREPDDLARVLALADRPDSAVFSGLTRVIRAFSDGQLTGAASDAVVKLLDAASSGKVLVRNVRGVLRGLSGAQVSPEIEKRVLAMARNRTSRDSAVRDALATWPDKSRAVVDVLLEAAVGGNRTARDALAGLWWGVRAEDQRHVADAMVRLLESRTDPERQTACLRLIGKYGSSDLVQTLEAWAANEQLAESVRTRAAAVIAQLKRK